MRNVLITGGTGTWGQEITKQLLGKGVKRIIIFSRAERSQEQMKRRFNDKRIEYVLGDVTNYPRVRKAVRGCDTIFHTAALKAIPNMEEDCMYGYKINVGGTDNLVKAAVSNGVKRFVFVGTDKAVNPINAYGLSKAMAEVVVKQAAQRCPKVNFKIVRSGNVIGSSSSVLHMWKESLQSNNTLKITEPEMTRFFITVEEAVQGLISSFKAKGVLHANLSKHAKLETLAKVAVQLWGNEDSDIIVIGNRGGEKLHEQMFSAYEIGRDIYSCDTQEYTVEELKEIINNEL